MKDVLYIKEGRKRTNLPFDRILFIEKYGAKVFIYTLEKRYSMYATFYYLIEILDQRFFCPHKSYIFNLDHIYEINERGVRIGKDYWVEMGEKCLRKLRKKMDENACKH